MTINTFCLINFIYQNINQNKIKITTNIIMIKISIKPSIKFNIQGAEKSIVQLYLVPFQGS